MGADVSPAWRSFPLLICWTETCVRLHQGDYEQVTRFSDDPVAQALSWQQQGATRLHLVDLDGAKRGEPVNDSRPSRRSRQPWTSRCSSVAASAPWNGLSSCSPAVLIA